MANKKNFSHDRDGFIIYKSLYEPTKHLSNEEKGILFTAIFKYQILGEEPELFGEVKMAFSFIKNQFILDEKKYEEKCSTNKKTAEEAWRKARENKGLDDEMQTHANACKRIQKHANEADKDKDKDKDIINININNNKKINKKEAFTNSIPEDNLKKCLSEWLEYRTDLKNKKQWEYQYKQLKSLADPIGTVEKSIGNNYKGLYETVNNKKNNQQQNGIPL